MKRITINRILAILVAATFVFESCTKEMSEVRLESRIATTQYQNVTSNSATVVGFVASLGEGFSEKGVCYNTATAPTVANSKIAYTGQATTATFNVALTGLNYATKYYVRAYATINGSGTIYGEEFNFTTLPVISTLTTDAITAITGNSATGGGNVTVTGGNDPSVRGVCFGTATQPTIAGSKTTDGKGPGAFVSALTGLKGNTTYYVRAYATNSAGTAYGPEVTFKTLIDLPVVTTAAATSITKISAISGGAITSDGGGTITAKGLVWGLAANPTIADKKIDGGTGTDAFVSNLTGLTVNTVYHIRAFATNSTGTAYGADIQFSTLADITKLWVVGDYNGWDNSDNARIILSTLTSNGTAEGYVMLKKGGLKLVTDHSWSNPATFGDGGAGKLTNPGGNIAVPSDGYYLIKANLGTMTYSLTLTTWGIIGDATAGGWSNQTDMVYDATSMTFRLVAHLTGGKSIKFRGTSDWGINYGSTSKDANLNAGGDNIPVSLESDYSITLDLSVPNAYKYSANRWGVIGDATADGWNSDQNMTWDATKKVFTATIDLKAGAIKFRANDDWAVNYGGSIGALTINGANIAVAAAGNYTITFDPWGLKATVTKN